MWKRLFWRIERTLDYLRYGVLKYRTSYDDLEIKTYLGFGYDKSLHIRGRVLSQKVLPKATATDPKWRNLLRAIRHWFTDEVPYARIRFDCFGTRGMIVCNDEGYFFQTIDLPNRLEHGYLDVGLKLERPASAPQVVSFARCFVPSADASLGVISDVDDTVFATGATSLGTMLKNTLLQNSQTREVFEGVAEFYTELAGGTPELPRNPIFYVTSSPWNLYGMINEVFALRGVPAGPLFMKDWGIDETKFFKSGHHAHKIQAIETVLNAQIDFPFVLFGDSGQEDPEIYTDIVERYPGRIAAVYIRDVTEAGRVAEIEELKAKCRAEGVDLLLSAETGDFVHHARSLEGRLSSPRAA